MSQHMLALQRANELRTKRAKDKRDIASLPPTEGFGVAADILEELPDCWARARPLELLMSIRYVGRQFALTWLRKAGVPEHRQLRELTERQRRTLAGLFRQNKGRVAA